MDSKGIATVDLIFTIFLTLTIACIGLNLIGNNIENQMIIEDEINVRMVVDNIANSINQVNSNSLGHIQEITLPNNISNKSFVVTLKQNEVVIVFGNRKGKSTIFPTRLANTNGDIVNEIKLYPGESVKIQKSLNNDNLAVIKIYRV